MLSVQRWPWYIMDGVTAGQIRSAQLWETVERKNSALVQVLKQTCSRNKAVQKQDCWEAKDVQDHGSINTISLKTAAGEFKQFGKIPEGATVTENNINRYAEERERNADAKEDVQLNRFCNGNDTAWRPDTFFTDVCGGDEIPPWPIRPTELFTNPHLMMRIMAEQMERRKQKKQEKKERKEKGKKSKKDKKEKSKKSKHKGKKVKKEKEKKAKKHKKDKHEGKDGPLRTRHEDVSPGKSGSQYQAAKALHAMKAAQAEKAAQATARAEVVQAVWAAQAQRPATAAARAPAPADLAVKPAPAPAPRSSSSSSSNSSNTSASGGGERHASTRVGVSKVTPKMVAGFDVSSASEVAPGEEELPDWD